MGGEGVNCKSVEEEEEIKDDKQNLTEILLRQNLYEEFLPLLTESGVSKYLTLQQLLPLGLMFLNAYKGIERNVTKVLDASGKPPAGILQGAVHWAGDYESCLKIKSPFGPGNLSEHNPLIHGQYCSVKIDFPKEGFIKKIPVALLPIFGPQLNGMSVIWDICTTQRCSAPELKTLFTPAFNLLNRFASVNLTSVVCKKPPNLLKHNEAIGAL
ncbi:Hypothetical predicted protein [Octopus vulgaris]|uniref:Nose resistant-to-fluoxetine protein N-terminal domain-containing protein n=1 Tax=Octopus vulgaris TaxID=6645 RepID=A0AA36BVR3_OCTVU|nr:Hypothetical predicted protein [Octopus vulgaris]